MAETTLILRNSFYLKKLRIRFWKNSRLLNKTDQFPLKKYFYGRFPDFYENA